MFKRIDYVMVMVSDMSRSVRFYRDILGFRLRFESPGWTEFDTEGTTLALHGGASPGPQGTPARQETRAGTLAMGLTVSNLDATVRMLRQQGVPIVVEPTLRDGEGIRLAVFTDPDGLAISLAEPVPGR